VDNHIKIVDKPIAEITRAIAVRKEKAELLEWLLNKAIGTFVGTPGIPAGLREMVRKAYPVLDTENVHGDRIGTARQYHRSHDRMAVSFGHAAERELATAVVERNRAMAAAVQNQDPA